MKRTQFEHGSDEESYPYGADEEDSEREWYEDDDDENDPGYRERDDAASPLPNPPVPSPSDPADLERSSRLSAQRIHLQARPQGRPPNFGSVSSRVPAPAPGGRRAVPAFTTDSAKDSDRRSPGLATGTSAGTGGAPRHTGFGEGRASAHHTPSGSGGRTRGRKAGADGGRSPGEHPPIVVLVHDRAQALERLLLSVRRAQGADLSRVAVYQDGIHRGVEQVVREFHPVRLVRLPQQPHGADDLPVLSSRLTYNYRFMLEHAFAQGHPFVLVLEDDLEVAPDALLFFTWAADVMQQDPTIFCASGYNDNGFDAATADPARVWRGEHFMALGWMVSREAFEQVSQIFRMDQVWDVPFAVTMAHHREGQGARRECIFPEMPRTKHVGDRSRGWLTTSASAQQLWFDLMALHSSPTGLSAMDLQAATAQGSHQTTVDLVESATVMRCLWEALVDNKQRQGGVKGGQVMVFPFETSYSADDAGQDAAWDKVAAAFGLLGRGNGWDRLPRGYHRGMVRTRVGHSLVILMSSASPYLSVALEDAVALGGQGFPPAPESRDDITYGQCAPPDDVVVQALQSWVVAPSGKTLGHDGKRAGERRSCAQVCEAEGRRCSVEEMWWALAVPDCAVIDGLLRGYGDEAACSNGCELEAGGVYAPMRDEEEELCKIPSPVAMSCERVSLSSQALLICPCLADRQH